MLTSNQSTTPFPEQPDPLTAQLAVAFDAVGALVAAVRSDQWSAPTPCTDWTARRLVDHLIGMNRVFAALLVGQTPPGRPAADLVEPDPVGAYRDSARALLTLFAAPGALDSDYEGPMGSATGAQRLQIRLYDLIAHGWDLAQATGQKFALPDGLAERSLAFARTQLLKQDRSGRFAPAQPVDELAPAVEHLAAFLGRRVDPLR